MISNKKQTTTKTSQANEKESADKIRRIICVTQRHWEIDASKQKMKVSMRSLQRGTIQNISMVDMNKNMINSKCDCNKDVFSLR